MKKPTFIFLGILVLIIAAFVLTKQQVISKDISFGKKAPEFLLKDVNGMDKKLSDFKGKVIILNFWTTWCPSCRKAVPDFIDLYDQYKGKGLEVIGISMDSKPKRILPAFIEEYNINYTILLGDEEVCDLYGDIGAIPTTFVLDKDGNIRKKYIGYNEKKVFEKDIKELL